MPRETQVLGNAGYGGRIIWTCMLDIADIPTKFADIKVKAEKSVLHVTGKSTFDKLENGFKMRRVVDWAKDVQLPVDYD